MTGRRASSMMGRTIAEVKPRLKRALIGRRKKRRGEIGNQKGERGRHGEIRPEKKAEKGSVSHRNERVDSELLGEN
jgi:hypothetical protein